MSTQNGGFPKLPLGFKFHPTDDELLSHYLIPKIASGREIPSSTIKNLDVYSYDPDQLPLDEFEYGREKEGYFILLGAERSSGREQDSIRTTPNGYWKIFEENVPIFEKNDDKVIGFKNECFFYHGIYPNGNITDWKMSEYRCNPEAVATVHASDNNDFIICKIGLKDIVEEVEEEEQEQEEETI